MKNILASKSRAVKEENKKMVSKKEIPVSGNTTYGISLSSNELETLREKRMWEENVITFVKVGEGEVEKRRGNPRKGKD